MTELPVRLLHPDARPPFRAYDGDAGFDLVSVEAASLLPGARASLGCGIAIELPEGTCGLVLPRSGLAREPRARQDEPARALGQLDRDAAAERGAGAGQERRRLDAHEVEPRIAVVGAERRARVGMQQADRQLGHLASRTGRDEPERGVPLGQSVRE